MLWGEVIGWQDWHDVAFYTKVSQALSWPLVMSLLRHIIPSSRHMMMSNAFQSLLDRSFLVSRYLSGKYHTLFIMWSFSIMLYHPFSHTMSYAPIFTHLWTNSFPMTTLSLCLCWFICSHDPLHFLNDLTKSFSPSFLPLFFIVVVFMGRTFVEFCHGHSFST